MPTVFAHETWFTDGPFPSDWSFAGETLSLALLTAALAVTLLVRLIALRLPGADVPFLARLVPWMPFAVRMHLGASLVGLLSMGVYLSPAMDLEPTLGGIALGVTMGAVAFLMITGWHARAAAALLVAAGPLGMLEFGVGPVLQRADLLGLAVFVLFAGAGRWSADAEGGRFTEPSLADLGKAVWALRVGAGVALIVVAFAEKLANPEMALAFLAEHPDFNVAALAGLPLGDLEFVRLAGAVEVLFGLLLISGALPQAIVLIAGIPFNATLWFFGTDELIGHLPVYGAMLVLLAYGSDPALRPAVSALWPFGRPSLGVPEPVSMAR
ncbi:MAG: hypothetical protein HOQ03_13220 [Thermoleophilia bacterium]|nr:hypothetical protein [Thermoleophilia bacterium]